MKEELSSSELFETGYLTDEEAEFINNMKEEGKI